MLKVGLTGGIGSGKSVVSNMLSELGAVVIDADTLAREALEPGRPAHAETVRLFGRRIQGSDGRIDRRALAEIVFRDKDARRKLEEIVHPRVFEEEARITREAASRDPRAIVVFDAALLIESGAHKRMDRLVVVWCPRETQIARLTEKLGLSPAEAELRIAAQAPLDDKRAIATHVIVNDGALTDTRAEVERLFTLLKQYV